MISKKNFSRLEEEEDKVAHTSPLLLEETTTGVDDELKGAAGEISRLGADAHAPIVILFYVVYRVFLLSLTKSILEKKRKRAVFHKLNYFFTTRRSFWEQKKTDFEREEREQKKRPKNKTFFETLKQKKKGQHFFFFFFFSCFPLFLYNETKCDIETK